MHKIYVDTSIFHITTIKYVQIYYKKFKVYQNICTHLQAVPGTIY